MSCPEIRQSIYTYVEQPAVVWRSDVVLEPPVLLAPENESTVCPSNTGGYDNPSGITLEWEDPVDADWIIIQVCDNSSFNGPTLRSVKVLAGEESYQLSLISEIRHGESVYWRAMAYSNSGGVSPKSDAWQFTYDCGSPGKKGGSPPSPAGRRPSLCELYEVKMEVAGPDVIMACSQENFNANVVWTCEDGDGNEILRLDSVQWSVENDPAHPGQITTQGPTNGMEVIVNIDCEFSGLFAVVFCATFTHIPTSQQFVCCERKKFRVHERDIPQNKPQFQLNDPTKLKIYMHPDYTSLGSGTYMYPSDANKSVLGRGSNVVAKGPVMLVSQDVAPEQKARCKIPTGDSQMVGMESVVNIPVPWVCDHIKKEGKADSGLKCDDETPSGLMVDNEAECTFGINSVTGLSMVLKPGGHLVVDLVGDSYDFGVTEHGLVVRDDCEKDLSWSIRQYVDIKDWAISGGLVFDICNYCYGWYPGEELPDPAGCSDTMVVSGGDDEGINDNYTKSGTYNGEPAWVNSSSPPYQYWIWWDSTAGEWRVSQNKGDDFDYYAGGGDANCPSGGGAYTGFGVHTGTILVQEG